MQINSLRDQIEMEMKRKAYTSHSDLANLSGSVHNLSYGGGDKSVDFGAGVGGLDYTPTRLTPRSRSPFKRSARTSPLPTSVAKLRAGSLPRSRTDISKLH